MNLKPCPYRHVGEEGHILCNKIKSGDREVSPNICRACPISQINCAHLRATLDNQSRPPIVVRWGNGKTQVWNDFATQSISLERAACAAKVTPIHSARDCAGCPLRQPLIAAEAIAPADAKPQVADDRRATVVARAPRITPRSPAPVAQLTARSVQPAPMAQATPPPAPRRTESTTDMRSSVVAQKIIQLQEWLTKQKNAPTKKDEENAVTPIVASARPARAVGEEKRVGWTD